MALRADGGTTYRRGLQCDGMASVELGYRKRAIYFEKHRRVYAEGRAVSVRTQIPGGLAGGSGILRKDQVVPDASAAVGVKGVKE